MQLDKKMESNAELKNKFSSNVGLKYRQELGKIKRTRDRKLSNFPSIVIFNSQS